MIMVLPNNEFINFSIKIMFSNCQRYRHNCMYADDFKTSNKIKPIDDCHKL